MSYATTAAALAAAVAETVTARDNANAFETALAGRLATIASARAEAVALGATPIELMAFDRLSGRLTEAGKVLSNYVIRLDEDVRAIDPTIGSIVPAG